MKAYTLLSALCFCCLITIAQTPLPVNKTFAERYIYIDTAINKALYPHGDTGKVLQQYEDLERIAEKYNDHNLQQQVQLERGLLLLYKYPAPPGTHNPRYQQQVSRWTASVSKLKERNEKYLYPYALTLYSRYLDSRGRFNEAFEYKLRAYERYNEFSATEYPPKYRNLRDLGDTFYDLQDYHSAKKCYKAVVDSNTFSDEYMPSLNTYALCYRKLRILDTAEYYFQLLLDKADTYNSAEWKLIANLNLGQTRYLMHDNNAAYQYFSEAYNYAVQHGFRYGTIESMSMLAKLEFESGNYAGAKNLALAGTRLIGEDYWYYYYKTEAQILYGILADIYEREGNYKSAYLYHDSLLMVVDSAASSRRLNISNAIQTRNRLLQSKYVQEQQNAQIAREKQVQMRNGILIGIFLLGIISLLLINRQRVKKRQLQAEKESAEARLAVSRQQLMDYTQHLQEKNLLLEEFTHELERYNAATNAESRDKAIRKLYEFTILTEEDWVKFQQMFEQVHPGYLYRLKEKLPGLTPGETRFVVLCKLKLATKEMANILGVGASAIRKYRHQVRHKLSLPEDEKLQEIIEEI